MVDQTGNTGRCMVYNCAGVHLTDIATGQVQVIQLDHAQQTVGVRWLANRCPVATSAFCFPFRAGLVQVADAVDAVNSSATFCGRASA